MKKFLFFLLLLVSFLGCGDSESKKQDKQPKQIIEYNFYESGSNSVKLQGFVKVNQLNGELPTVDQLKDVASDIIEKNPKYENYFFNFTYDFIKQRPGKQADKFNKYYQISKLGKEDFRITNLYRELPYHRVTIADKNINLLGIKRLNEIQPIKLESSIEDIEKSLGKPSEINENVYTYYLTNPKNQMLGCLYITFTNSQVSSVSFYSPNLSMSKQDTQDIIKYLKGELNYDDLKIKYLEDIYDFDIDIDEFIARQKLSDMYLGIVDKYEINNYKDKYNNFCVEYGESGSRVIFKFANNSGVFNLNEVELTTRYLDDKTYPKFLENLDRVLVVINPDVNYFKTSPQILRELGISEEVIKNTQTKKTSYETLKYKYSFVKDKSMSSLKIRSK